MARKKKTVKLRLTPLPEAVSGDVWQVSEGPPCVDLNSRVMYVPTEDTDYAAFARAHEMVHVKITPHEPAHELARRENITLESFNVVEDLRVHSFMLNRGIPTAACSDENKRLEFVMNNAENKRMMAGMLLAIANTVEFENMERAILDLAPSGRQIVRLTKTIWDQFLELREKIMKEHADPIETMAGFSQLTAPIARLFDQVFPQPGAAPSAVEPSRYMRRGIQGHVPWGELMPLRTANMSLTKKPRGSSRIWTDEGVVPVAPYRLTVDSRVFARKRRIKGGTVLIDASGSMSFSEEELASVIDAAPGALIAAYAGRGERGYLAIVAKNGRMATGEAAMEALADCGGNIVDGPALRWLAKQPGPRIWVSDGMVTGINDDMGVNLMQDVNALVNSADIERVEEWRDVVEALS